MIISTGHDIPRADCENAVGLLVPPARQKNESHDRKNYRRALSHFCLCAAPPDAELILNASADEITLARRFMTELGDGVRPGRIKISAGTHCVGRQA